YKSHRNLSRCFRRRCTSQIIYSTNHRNCNISFSTTCNYLLLQKPKEAASNNLSEYFSCNSFSCLVLCIFQQCSHRAKQKFSIREYRDWSAFGTIRYCLPFFSSKRHTK